MPDQHRGQLYTLGYSGWKLDEFCAQIEAVNALLFDIRFSPNSRAPQWAQKNLRTKLQEKYVHVRDLGNRNYKGGPVDIVDYDAGKALVDSHLRTGNSVILLCVCADVTQCHRLQVATQLEADLKVTAIHLQRPRYRSKAR
jgi:uncharacterized protein (DUF488 family)